MARNYIQYDVPQITHQVASAGEFFDLILNALARRQPQFVAWLGKDFSTIQKATCEDIFQGVQMELIRKGLPALGVKELVVCSFPSTPAVLNAALEAGWKKAVNNFMRQLNHRAIDRVRRSKKEVVSDELVQEALALCGSRRIVSMECLEEFGELIKWFDDEMSEREQIVFKHWLEHLPDQPTLSELYDQLSDCERDVFLPRDERGSEERGSEERDPVKAIKSQLSRTMSSLRKKLKGFGEGR
jgi:DNA-directed RNA polymerase specialized sigma24 family protein